MKSKNLTLIPLLLIISILVQGCATMDKDECLTADWYNIGYEDGMKGLRPDRISDHRKACAKHGVAPDPVAYGKGREKGLPLFCTPHQGYALGLAGRAHNNVCSGESKYEFLTAYGRGREIYNFQKDMEDLERELEQMDDKIQDLETRIRTIEEQMPQKCGDKEDCRSLISRMRRLEREKTELSIDLRQGEDELRAMERTLDEMKAGAGY